MAEKTAEIEKKNKMMADIVQVMGHTDIFFFASLLVTGDFETELKVRDRQKKICHPCCLLDFGITSGAAPRCWRLGGGSNTPRAKKKDKGR